MGTVRKINPATGKVENVKSIGAIRREGGDPSQQFSGKYSADKTPAEAGAPYTYEGTPGNQIPFRNDEQAALAGYYGKQGEEAVNASHAPVLKSKGAVSSSDLARKAVEEYQKKLKGINQKLGTYQNDLKASKAEQEAMRRQQQAQLELAKAKKGDVFREDYDQTEEETTDMRNPLDSIYDQTQEYTNSYLAEVDTQTNKYLKQLKNFGATMDDDNNFLLDSISDTFNQRRQEAREIGKRQIAGLTSQGLRTGQTRYANEIQQGVISAAEQSIIQNISKIDTEEKKSIVEANKAFAEGKFKLFTEQMKTVEEAQKTKAGLVQDLYENAIKRDDQLLQARQEDRMQVKDELDRQEQTAKMLALSVFTEGGGKDVIEKYAQEYGIDPMYLSSYVQQERIEANKRYQDAIKAGKSNVISAKDAFSMGLPSSVVGLSEDEVYTDLTSSLPPKWFIDIQNATAGDNGVGMSLNPEATLQNWNEYRNANYDAGEPTPDLGVKPKGNSLESQIESLF